MGNTVDHESRQPVVVAVGDDAKHHLDPSPAAEAAAGVASDATEATAAGSLSLSPAASPHSSALSHAARARCPFSNLDKPIVAGAPVRCPFHAHQVPESFHVTSPVPLNVHGATHYRSDATADLLRDIGGGDRIREFCTRFYALFFADPVLKQFLFETDGPEAHAKRLADWIIQKMDEGQEPWTESGRWGMRQPSHHRVR